MSITPAPSSPPAGEPVVSVPAPPRDARAAAYNELADAMRDDIAKLLAPDPEPAGRVPPTDGPSADRHGAPAPQAEPPATIATPPADATHEQPKVISLTEAELAARIEDATKRASAHQSKMADELKAANAERDRLNAEYQRLTADNRMLFDASQRVKSLAREQGSVGPLDVDDATMQAIQQRQQYDAMTQQQQHAADEEQRRRVAEGAREAQDRERHGRGVYEATVSAIFEAAAAAKVPLARKEVEGLIKTGYADPLVAADLRDWEDLSTPAAKAQQRVTVAFQRIAEHALRAVTQQAMAAAEGERDERPTYDRTQTYGEPNANIRTSDRPTEPRKQANWAHQLLTEAFDEDRAAFRAGRFADQPKPF